MTYRCQKESCQKTFPLKGVRHCVCGEPVNPALLPSAVSKTPWKALKATERPPEDTNPVHRSIHLTKVTLSIQELLAIFSQHEPHEACIDEGLLPIVFQACRLSIPENRRSDFVSLRRATVRFLRDKLYHSWHVIGGLIDRDHASVINLYKNGGWKGGLQKQRR